MPTMSMRGALCQPAGRFRYFDDQIRGPIEFSNQELDDLIIRRTDGSPTYNFCVVVDDWDMEITHVIRGEDHINNTPRQINILKALNAPVPMYAHVSMINGDDGKKLSKRHGAVSVMQYRDDGYLPEALLNYLVRLGWSSGDQEIFTREEMIKLFSLGAVSKSASAFNTDKLLWLNHHYINTLAPEYVATHLQWHIEQENIDTRNGPQLAELVKLLGERCKTLKEMAQSCRYFYEDFSEFDADAAKNTSARWRVSRWKWCATSCRRLRTGQQKTSTTRFRPRRMSWKWGWVKWGCRCVWL